MSEPGEEDDKQYEPSQKKLDDARLKGDIPRSVDLTTAAAYGGFLLAAMMSGPASVVALGSALAGLLGRADTLSATVFSGSAGPLVGGLIREVSRAVLPWFGLPAVLALLAIIAQRGFVLAPDKLVPKSSRVSLLESLRNKFGRNGLFEFAKSAVKLIIYSVILGIYLNLRILRIIETIHMSPGILAAELGYLALEMLFIVLAVALVLGGIDQLWQQAEHIRKNRMSRKELIDEQKQSEGDPLMKQQRRQRAISLAMNRMLADVPSADVVIVNPAHYAVALKWDRSPGSAPVCVAKGMDEIAARIREIAAENGVPVHADPPTARALHAAVEIGQQIRPEDYRPVAAAIRFAETMRQKARGR